MRAHYEACLKLYESRRPYHSGSQWSFSDGELVAYWKFDEVEGGMTPDSTKNDMGGMIVGDASIVTDPERGNVNLQASTGGFHSAEN